MNKDYRTIADKILEERDVYYKKRAKAVKTALYSLIPLFIISISFLFWPKPSGSSQPPKNYLYVEMTVEKSTADGFSVVKISNVRRCFYLFLQYMDQMAEGNLMFWKH